MSEKTTDEIRAILDDLAEKKIEIDGQITTAKRKFASGDGAADVDWLRRAEHASKMTGRDIQYWQSELGKARKAEKQKNASQFGEMFIKCAREMLPPETFSEIMRAAKSA